jgi:hypothetical protein
LLPHINIRHLIYIDIETVPQYAEHAQLNPAMQEMWAAKHALLRTENETAEEGYLLRAGVYAEFAKIICISMGFFHIDKETNKRTFRIKSFYGDDEKQLLAEFTEVINKHFSDTDLYSFCGHNIREFDVPFICRRLLVNQLPFPALLNLSGKRPWETNNVDTMQLCRGVALLEYDRYRPETIDSHRFKQRFSYRPPYPQTAA